VSKGRITPRGGPSRFFRGQVQPTSLSLSPRASLIHETAYADEMSCARLASCPPPTSVMVITGDPPAGGGQLATSRQIEATHGPGTSDVTVDRNALPRKCEVPEQ
jgi:hypothetical protein